MIDERSRRAGSLRALLCAGFAASGQLAIAGDTAEGASIAATWVAGSGSYSDSTRWVFDSAPSSASIPDNDLDDTFRVLVDADPVVASAVSLDSSVGIDSIEIDVGDALSIANGATLTLVRDSARPGSGEVRNDGLVNIESIDLDTVLSFVGGLDLSGTGRIRISGRRRSGIFSEDSSTLTNQIDHTIEGAGSIAASHFENLGSVVADGRAKLELSFFSMNQEGTLLARNGTLDLGSSRFDNDGTIIVATRGVLTGSLLENRGYVEVTSGGSFSTALLLRNRREAAGLLVAGPGSQVFAAAFCNYGVVDVLDSGTILASRFDQQFYPSAMTTVGEGSTITVTGRVDIFEGLLKLDGGAITAADEFRIESPASLEGNGSVEILLPNRAVLVRGAISPGTSEPGVIDVLAGMSLVGVLLVDLRGTADVDYDRILVRDAVVIGSGFVNMNLLEGFEPRAGDSFDVVQGAAVSVLRPLDDLMVLHSVGSDLFFVPEIAASSVGQALRIRVLQSIDAIWAGASGVFADPSGWTFSSMPTAAQYPANDGSNLFRARIGGSTAGAVVLETDAELDRLRIEAGFSFVIDDGSTLTIAGGSSRIGSGIIENDGTLTLNGAGAPTVLSFNSSLSLSGAGSLALSSASSEIAAAAPKLTLINEAGHKIEGSGFVRSGIVQNFGAIFVGAGDRLVVETSGLVDSTPNFLNEGTLEARDGGLLEISTPDSTFNGQVTVTSGGTLNVRDSFQPRIEGEIFVSGTGSMVSFIGPPLSYGTIEVYDGAEFFGGLNNRGTFRVVSSHAETPLLFNYGLVEMLEGGTLSTSAFNQSSRDAVTRIGEGSSLHGRFDLFLGAGLIELDGGTLRAEDGIRTESVIAGSGRIEPGAGLLRIRREGTLDPGGASVGHFEIAGMLDLEASGIVWIDIGGTMVGEFDQLTGMTDVQLAGLVAVSLVDLSGVSEQVPFDPPEGVHFDVMVADSISDLGATYSLPDLSGGRLLKPVVATTATNQVLRLVVVPEPDASALQLVVLVALGALRAGCRRASGSSSRRDPSQADVPSNAGRAHRDARSRGPGRGAALSRATSGSPARPFREAPWQTNRRREMRSRCS